jgi:outer membrane protein OmpA-like peptidoglycan-associated protein
LGDFLQETPQAYAILAGFTDNMGDEEYNMGLSRRRAESVAGYLYEKFDISVGQIVLHWYGEAAPVDRNDTDEGRSQNRRVACIIAGLK